LVEWRLLQILVEENVIEEIERKYGKSIEEALDEIIHEVVCKRVLNRCSECNAEIFIFVLEKDWKSQEIARNTRNAQWSVCNPMRVWKRLE